MGGTKTKTVGGGQAAPLANEWFSFLSNTLKQGGNQPGAGAVQNMYGQMQPNVFNSPQPGMTNTMGTGMGTANQTPAYAGGYQNPMPTQLTGMFGTPAANPIGGPPPNNMWTNFMGGSPNTGVAPVSGMDNSQIPFLGQTGPMLGGGNGIPSGPNNEPWRRSGSPAGGYEGVPNKAMGFLGGVPNDGSSGAPQGGMPGFPGGVGTTTPTVDQGGNNGFFSGQGGQAVLNAINQKKQQFNVPGVSGFAGGIEGLMNPDIGGMIGNNPFLAGLMNFNPTANFGDAPSWVNTQFQNPNQINPQSVGYNNAAAGTTDLGGFMSQFGGDVGRMLSSVGINPSQIGNVNLGIPGLNNPSGDFSYGAGSLKDFTKDPSYQAILADIDRSTMKDTADLRERYGMMGNTMSSGASLAEAQLRAEAIPKKTIALGGLGRELQGLDLQQQGVNNSLRTGLLNAQVSDALGRAGIMGDLQKAGAQIGSGNIGNLMQFLGQTQGQNIGAATSLANNNAGNTTQTNIANSQGGLQAGQINAGNSLQAQIANANNTMGMNQLNLNQGLGQNTFNQNNFAQMSQNIMGNAQLRSQFAQFVGSAGLDLQRLAQSGQMGMIQALMQAFGQAAGLGTPQAQTVQQPSALSQALNFGLGAAGTIGGIMTGNPAAALGGAGTMAGSFSSPQLSSLQPGGYFSGSRPSLFPQ